MHFSMALKTKKSISSQSRSRITRGAPSVVDDAGMVSHAALLGGALLARSSGKLSSVGHRPNPSGRTDPGPSGSGFAVDGSGERSGRDAAGCGMDFSHGGEALGGSGPLMLIDPRPVAALAGSGSSETVGLHSSGCAVEGIAPVTSFKRSRSCSRDIAASLEEPWLRQQVRGRGRRRRRRRWGRGERLAGLGFQHRQDRAARGDAGRARFG